MLWKETWEPEAVLALLGGIVAAFFFGGVAGELMHHAGVAGFKSDFSVGNVLLATLSFHGTAIVLGALFLKATDTSWREVLGTTGWKRNVGLAVAMLAVVTPVVLGLKAVSDQMLHRLHWSAAEEPAVDMIIKAGPWVRGYLVVFTVMLAPLAEEFVFRGLLFSTAKRCGWPKLGWLGVSALFALIHFNAPTFLSLFVLALALTWLYEKTDGLLAPIMAHSLFNLANLVYLLIAIKYHPTGS